MQRRRGWLDRGGGEDQGVHGVEEKTVVVSFVYLLLLTPHDEHDRQVHPPQEVTDEDSVAFHLQVDASRQSELSDRALEGCVGLVDIPPSLDDERGKKRENEDDNLPVVVDGTHVGSAEKVGEGLQITTGKSESTLPQNCGPQT